MDGSEAGVAASSSDWVVMPVMVSVVCGKPAGTYRIWVGGGGEGEEEEEGRGVELGNRGGWKGEGRGEGGEGGGGGGNKWD